MGGIRHGDETEYRGVVDRYTDWCELNQMQLYISKTKELVVELRRSWFPITLLSSRGEKAETVQGLRDTLTVSRTGQRADVLRDHGGQCSHLRFWSFLKQTQSNTEGWLCVWREARLLGNCGRLEKAG